MTQAQSVVESIDKADAKGKDASELLDVLIGLAQAKADMFKMEIQQNLRTAGTQDNPTIPIESILDDTTEIRAMTTDSIDHLGTTVAEALGGFIGSGFDIASGQTEGGIKNIVSNIGSLISAGLKVFLGQSSGSENIMHRYYVLQQGFALVRVDLKCWSREVKAEALREKTQKIVVYVATRSSIDLTKVRFNTFLSVYQQQLSGTLSKDEVKAALKDAKEIFDLYVSSAQPQAKGFDFSLPADSSHHDSVFPLRLLPNQDLV
jgi:hypothetical protein